MSIKFEIVKEIAVLSESKNWTKELNIVKWEDNPPKYDIRNWSENHEKPGKGITLSKEEMEILISSMSEKA